MCEPSCAAVEGILLGIKALDSSMILKDVYFNPPSWGQPSCRHIRLQACKKQILACMVCAGLHKQADAPAAGVRGGRGRGSAGADP